MRYCQWGCEAPLHCAASAVSSGRKLVFAGVCSGRKLVSHRVLKPWQLLSVSPGRKLVFPWGFLQAGTDSSWRKLVYRGAVKPWQLLSVSFGRKLVCHGAVKPWQLLSVSYGGKLVCHGAVKPHCTAQQASAASCGTTSATTFHRSALSDLQHVSKVC